MIEILPSAPYTASPTVRNIAREEKHVRQTNSALERRDAPSWMESNGLVGRDGAVVFKRS